MMKNEKKSSPLMGEAVSRGVSLLRNNEFAVFPVLAGMLAGGEPVGIPELASRTGWSQEKLKDNLARHPSMEYDDEGRIAGFGITLRPTRHRFDFDGRTVYGWCASDVLLLPVLLGKSGVVTSVCPITEKQIRIAMTPDGVLEVTPPETVVSLVRPLQIADVRSEVCGAGYFISSRDAAKSWLDAHPEGYLHTVEEDFEVNREVLLEVGWIR